MHLPIVLYSHQVFLPASLLYSNCHSFILKNARSGHLPHLSLPKNCNNIWSGKACHRDVLLAFCLIWALRPIVFCLLSKYIIAKCRYSICDREALLSYLIFNQLQKKLAQMLSTGFTYLQIACLQGCCRSYENVLN